MTRQTKPRVMYMHTLDGKPASYCDMHDMQFLAYAGNGHRTRAATLVGSRRQIEREQMACVRSDLQQWHAMNPVYRGPQPDARRYGYVLVEVPS